MQHRRVQSCLGESQPTAACVQRLQGVQQDCFVIFSYGSRHLSKSLEACLRVEFVSKPCSSTKPGLHPASWTDTDQLCAWLQANLVAGPKDRLPRAALQQRKVLQSCRRGKPQAGVGAEAGAGVGVGVGARG